MTAVVGSGTGANYAITAGALQRLEEDGLEPSELVSTSGSCLSFAFRANGGRMVDFLNVAKATTPIDIIRPNWLSFAVPGLFHIDRAQLMMRPHVAKTFGECQIPFTVITFDSDMKKELRFSTEETPDAEVPPAVQASMAMPWIMRHVKVGGVRATDGGNVRNFAIDVPQDPAVGIRVLGAESGGKPWRWWGSYSWNQFDGMLQALEREHIEDALWQKHKIVTVKSPISGMDFHKVDANMIERLFEVGYNTVDKKLASGWNWGQS